MCLAQGQQRSDAGEAQTRGPSVSSQALPLSHCAVPPGCDKILLYCKTNNQLPFILTAVLYVA